MPTPNIACASFNLPVVGAAEHRISFPCEAVSGSQTKQLSPTWKPAKGVIRDRAAQARLCFKTLVAGSVTRQSYSSRRLLCPALRPQRAGRWPPHLGDSLWDNQRGAAGGITGGWLAMEQQAEAEQGDRGFRGGGGSPAVGRPSVIRSNCRPAAGPRARPLTSLY